MFRIYVYIDTHNIVYTNGSLYGHKYYNNVILYRNTSKCKCWCVKMKISIYDVHPNYMFIIKGDIWDKYSVNINTDICYIFQQTFE